MDVWLNGTAYWRAAQKNVWEFSIAGYLLQKVLSYREHEVLGRPITTAEAREATAISGVPTVLRQSLDQKYRYRLAP